MKQCPWCAQEMPETATVCEHCGPETLLPSADNAGRVENPAAPARGAVSSGTAMNRGHMFAIIAAVIGGGTLTFGLLMAAGGASEPAGSSEPRKLERSVSAASKLAASGPKWNGTNREWVGNARKGIAFELPALNKVAAWQRQVHPTLVVRCISNRTDVFIFTDSAAKMEAQDENHTVRVGFDDQPEFTERWPDSDEHDALFAPDGEAFARRVMAARTMRFAFTPHNASPVVAEFQVAGLSELIEPAARQCGWQK